MTRTLRPYRIGLIGSGVGTSLSPALHEQEARRLGLEYEYRTLDLDALGCAAADVPRLVTEACRAGFTGLNITHPGKQIVVEHLDELSPAAAALGAVNTVLFEGDRSVGHNTDSSGFAQSLTRGLPGARTRTVVLLGAGGAGTAVAHAVLGLGARTVTVVDVEPGRAVRLAAELVRAFGAGRAAPGRHDRLAEHLAAADGLIHATPTGMAAYPGLPLPADALVPDLWVAEVVYRPLETELLRHARGAGCRTLDGGGMAVFQAAHAFELFTGVRADPERMMRHFAGLVAADR
ncbi:MAG: shikimate dehydrogenase [Actinocatenispora sp.]